MLCAMCFSDLTLTEVSTHTVLAIFSVLRMLADT